MEGLTETVLLLAALLGCLCTCLAEINCQNNRKARQHHLQCFHDQGINLTVPLHFLEDTSKDRKKSYIDAVLSLKPDLLCSHQTQFQLAFKCIMNKTIHCMPPELRGYLPQPNSMSKIVDVLCNNETSIDYECIKWKAEDMYDCGIRKLTEFYEHRRTKITAAEALCKGFQYNAECQISELRTCGCSTVKAYETITRDLAYPPSCPDLHEPPVQCNESKSEYFTGNGAYWPRTLLTANIAMTLVLIFVLVFVL